jgi:hypothetical protein
MEARSKSFVSQVHSISSTAQIEKEGRYLDLPVEESTSDGSGFQFVKNGNSAAIFLQQNFVLKKGRKVLIN